MVLSVKTILISLLVVAAIAIGAVAGKKMVRSVVDSTAEEIQKALTQGLEEAAKGINDKGPKMLDDITRLDKATVASGGRITYHHTLVKFASTEISAADLQTKLRPAIVAKVCESKEMFPALRLGATFSYEYSSNDGVVIDTLHLTKVDCKL